MPTTGRAVLEDCLYLNWALPRAGLPEPPSPLRYDVLESESGEVVFASGILCRHRRARFRFLPLARVSYPQFQLQLCTLDGDGAPSVWIRSILLPAWVTPGARWIADQPARTADFSYPRSVSAATGRCVWKVSRGATLTVEAEPGSPSLGDGPALGSWERTVSYLGRRPAAYATGARGLHHLLFEPATDNVVPMTATVRRNDLLGKCLSMGNGAGRVGEDWPELHSAWLCPPMAASFVAARVPVGPVGNRIPAPG